MQYLNFPVHRDRRLKIALVGCGRISKKHFDAIKAHKKDLELVGVCDCDIRKMEAAAIEQKVPGFLSLDQMLNKTDADIIVLCTPSGLHAQQTIECANSGRHIITEKPMATSWYDGLAMVRACEKNKVRLFVVKQNRFNPTLQALKVAVDTGRFGRVYLVSSNVFWTRPQQYYDEAKWRGRVGLDGGAIMNQASHYVDLMTWLFGPAESVHAFTVTLARKIECEDTGVINIKWGSGMLGTMAVTMLTYPKNLEGSITVIGEHGTVKVGGTAVNKIEHWRFLDTQSIDATIDTLNYEIDSVYGYGHFYYYGNIIEVMRGTQEATVDGNEGLKSLELLVGTYISAAQGTVVTFPLNREIGKYQVPIRSLEV